MSLIDDILNASRKRLEWRKQSVPLSELRARAADAPRSAVTFRSALESRPFSIIAEVKHRSPSGGAMDTSNVTKAMGVYDASPSVTAVSILTDEDYFGGSIASLQDARAKTAKPLLRKDFIVDEYQVWEARAFGADALLLMSGLHLDNPSRVGELAQLAQSLRMNVLFELGMSMSASALEKQVALMPTEGVIWGINSRRFETSPLKLHARLGSLLGTEWSIRTNQHRKLRSLIPVGQLAVAESGIRSPSEVRALLDLNYRAALIGTAFLRKDVRVSDVVSDFDEELGRISEPRSDTSVEHPPSIRAVVRN